MNPDSIARVPGRPLAIERAPGGTRRLAAWERRQLRIFLGMDRREQHLWRGTATTYMEHP